MAGRPAKRKTGRARESLSHVDMLAVGLVVARFGNRARSQAIEGTKETATSNLPCIAQRLIAVFLSQTVVLSRRVL